MHQCQNRHNNYRSRTNMNYTPNRIQILLPLILLQNFLHLTWDRFPFCFLNNKFPSDLTQWPWLVPSTRDTLAVAMKITLNEIKMYLITDINLKLTARRIRVNNLNFEKFSFQVFKILSLAISSTWSPYGFHFKDNKFFFFLRKPSP